MQNATPWLGDFAPVAPRRRDGCRYDSRLHPLPGCTLRGRGSRWRGEKPSRHGGRHPVGRVGGRGRLRPLAAFNERMFSFNHDVLDRWLIKPAASGWAAICPDMARRSLARLFDNFDMPRRLVNNLLQARPLGAGRRAGALRREHDGRHRRPGGRGSLMTSSPAMPTRADARHLRCRGGPLPGAAHHAPADRPRRDRTWHRRLARSRRATSCRFVANRAKSIFTAVNERSLNSKLLRRRRGQRTRSVQRGAQRLSAAAPPGGARAVARTATRNGPGAQPPGRHPRPLRRRAGNPA